MQIALQLRQGEKKKIVMHDLTYRVQRAWFSKVIRTSSQIPPPA